MLEAGQEEDLACFTGWETPEAEISRWPNICKVVHPPGLALLPEHSAASAKGPDHVGGFLAQVGERSITSWKGNADSALGGRAL